jgi:hypothetical protein
MTQIDVAAYAGLLLSLFIKIQYAGGFVGNVAGFIYWIYFAVVAAGSFLMSGSSLASQYPNVVPDFNEPRAWVSRISHTVVIVTTAGMGWYFQAAVWFLAFIYQQSSYHTARKILGKRTT